MAAVEGAPASAGPVLLAFDGSELAAFAIGRAGLELAPGREALVVVVWHPADVGFTPVDGRHLHAAAANEVLAAARETADRGVALAEAAGFRARGLAVEATPTWKGIADAANEHGATLIVFGSHRRSGLLGHLAGSVTASTAAHSAAAVLVVHAPE
ncbi:MAG: universal stress protein [Actinobacteria bacterium]|nr:universal stress protein [Actinomycetota bacterium]